MENQTNNSIYLIPLAIIIAGAAIGGGLAFGLSNSKESASPVVGDAATPEVPFSELLPKMAKAAGVDRQKLQSCMDVNKYTQEISDDAADAVKAGGQGTPYSIVIDAKGNKIPVEGAFPYENIKAIVDAALKGEEGPAPFNNELTFRAVSDEDHILGAKNATITIVEYSDLECPFCRRFHPTMQQVLKEYDGKVRWVYRHFPLTQIHPSAQAMALASECAAEQGKFWEMIDEIMKG